MKKLTSGQGPWYLRASKRLGAGVAAFLLMAVGLIAWHMNIAQAATLQDGVLAHWKMDEASQGDTVVDSGSGGYDGTSTGDADGGALPQPSTDVPTVDFSDPYSLDFDGTDDAVTTNFNLNGVGQYTVAGWLNPAAAGNRMSFFGQDGIVEFGFSDSTHIACYLGNGTTSTTLSWAFSSETFSLGQWHHVACANSGSTQTLYVDGTAVATASASIGAGSSVEPFTLGAGAWDPLSMGTGYFNGKLDDVYVYDRALTAGEISQLQATGNEEVTVTLQGGSSVTNEVGTSVPITDLQVSASSGNPTVPVKLLVSHGTLSMSTKTGLTFYTATGATGGSQSGSTLYFSGTLDDVNNALATLSYTRSSGAGTDTVEASLVNPGEVFFPGTNHLYEYVSVPGNITWTNAKTAAEARSKYGAQGYLTTIASQAENDFVASRLLNAGWMGASDSATEGTWKWVTGPENGTTFSVGNVNPATSLGQYANWNNGEPNDSSGEDCGQFLAGGTGKWNDLPCTGTGAGLLPGYVVEYGASGDLPEVSAKNITVTTSDTIAPSLTGAVTIPSSPTSDTTPTLSWNAASDGGLGLTNPAYRLEWSTSATFAGYVASGSNSLTTNTTSATTPSLANGTWYFRVVATDGAGNATTSAISNSLTIDTAAPTINTLVPADEATNVAVDAQLVMTFNESVQKGMGSVTVKRASDNSTVESLDVSSSAVVVSGDTVTMTLSADLENDTAYYVQASAGAFEDLVGNNFAGIANTTTWNFMTIKSPSQVALEKIQTYADTDGGSAAPTPSDYADAGISGVTSSNVADVNAAIAEADPADVTTQGAIQTLATPVIAFAKINAYATSAGTTSTPTVTDYADVGVTGVNMSNVATMNSFVVSGGPGATSSLSKLQYLANKTVAFEKIVEYAETDGASAAPTVADYDTVGVTGVTAANLAAVNAALAMSDPAQLASLAQIQSFVSESIAASRQDESPKAPNTGFAPENMAEFGATIVVSLGALIGGIMMLRGTKKSTSKQAR